MSTEPDQAHNHGFTDAGLRNQRIKCDQECERESQAPPLFRQTLFENVVDAGSVRLVHDGEFTRLPGTSLGGRTKS